MELKDQGLLEIKQGRRISVRDVVVPITETKQRVKELNLLIKQTLGRVRQLKINEIVFGRYLLSQALESSRDNNQLVFIDANMHIASERAKEISHFWGIPVVPAVLHNLRAVLTEGDFIRYAITPYHRLERAAEEIKQAGFTKQVEIIPIQVTFRPDFRQKLLSLKPNSPVWLFTHPDEFDKNGQSFADSYEEAFADIGVHFLVKQASTEADILKALRSPAKPLIIIYTELWDTLSQKTKNHLMVMRPQYEIDKFSLEIAKARAGIVTLPE